MISVGSGGQRGFEDGLSDQLGSLSNSADCTFDNAGEFLPASNSVQAAALWLHQHRSEVGSHVIPTLRTRYALTILEAIEAAQLAHALSHGSSAIALNPNEAQD